MTEIAEGIHRITCPFGDRVVYCHVITGEERTVLVDTGMAFTPEQDIFPYMDRIGVSPEGLDLVVVTHSDMDHQGGNDAVKEAAPQALFCCHALDAPWVESVEALIRGRYSQFEAKHDIGYGDEVKRGIAEDCRSHVPMDWRLQGGEQYRIGADRYLTFVHTPGHTWGHTAVWDERTGTVIASEAALSTSILGLHGQAALPPTYCYIDTYETTLERLLSMDIGVYSPAHWPIQRGNAVKAFLSDSLSYCRETEQKVLSLILSASEPLTLKEIIGRLNDTLGKWPTEVKQDLAFALSGHLRRLLDHNLIDETERDGLAAYRAVRAIAD